MGQTFTDQQEILKLYGEIYIESHDLLEDDGPLASTTWVYYEFVEKMECRGFFTKGYIF